MEIRELKARDIRTLVGLLRNLDPSSRQTLSVLFKGEINRENKAQMFEVGLAVFQVLAQFSDGIYDWLADMAGLKRAELDDMPASAVVEIVRGIIAREDIKGFLASAIRTAG